MRIGENKWKIRNKIHYKKSQQKVIFAEQLFNNFFELTGLEQKEEKKSEVGSLAFIRLFRPTGR